MFTLQFFYLSVAAGKVGLSLRYTLHVARTLSNQATTATRLLLCMYRLLLNSVLTVTGKFSVMTGTLFYVFGLCERHVSVERSLQKGCTSL